MTYQEGKLFEMKLKLEAADQVMMRIDDCVQRGILDARSRIADARLLYGDPFKYEFSNEKQASCSHTAD